MREAHNPMANHRAQTTRPSGQWPLFFPEKHLFSLARRPRWSGAGAVMAATGMQALGGSGGVAAVEESTAAWGTSRGSRQCH